MLLQVQEPYRFPANPQEPGEKTRTNSPSQPGEGASPADALISDLQLLEGCEYMSAVRPPSTWCFVAVALANSHNGTLMYEPERVLQMSEVQMLMPPSCFRCWLVESLPSNALPPDTFPSLYCPTFSSLPHFPAARLSAFTPPVIAALIAKGCEMFRSCFLATSVPLSSHHIEPVCLTAARLTAPWGRYRGNPHLTGAARQVRSGEATQLGSDRPVPECVLFTTNWELWS